MIERIMGRFPEAWRELIELAAAPIAWLPGLQHMAIRFFFDSPSGWAATAKFVFLLLPILLSFAAIWCTGFSVYTLPFRSRRIDFVSTLLMTWWDAASAVWMYWIGILRMGAVVIGWLVTLVGLALKLGFEALRQLVLLPWSVSGRMTDRYFRGGVPWLAFGMLLGWSALEATIFSFTLMPTLSQVLADLAGSDGVPRATGVVLWGFLFLLIMGSLASVQGLVEGVVKEANEPSWWKEPLADSKKEIGWLHDKSDELLEYLALPALHLLAAAMNFAMVLITARPVFALPFKSLKEVTETREMLGVHLQPKRQANA